MLKNGYIQIYTGNGKGKTTASLGVALRILGADGKVFYAQFIKGENLSSEFEILENFENFNHVSYGQGRFIKGKPSADDIESAQKGLKACGKTLASGNYDLVVMDELNGALKCGLFSIDQVMEVIKLRNSQTELIITGRNAPPELIEIADLVTEMTPIKHYFEQGIPARTGIEK